MEIKIGARKVGESNPPYFVADIAANHNGSLERAMILIEEAKSAGAHAAKFQNFTAPKIVSREGFNSLKSQMSHQAGWKKDVFDVYQDASLPQDWTPRLKEKCDEVGIEYFTSPYDFESVDHVDPYVNVYKIGSGDITWLQIIQHIGQKGKPVMLATGASNMTEVEQAVEALRRTNSEIILMQCNTNYTAQRENFKYLNLNVLRTFSHQYPELVLGLSDHTPGHASVLGALALGARVFEKHFTDDNELDGPDHKFSMNPQSWRDMVSATLDLFNALGDGNKRVEDNEQQTVKVQRRALWTTQDLTEGQTITSDDVFPLRPCPDGGISPAGLERIVGRRMKSALQKGVMLRVEHLVSGEE